MDSIIFSETQRFEFYNVLIIVGIAALIFFCVTKFRSKDGFAGTLAGKAVLYTIAALPLPFAVLFYVMALNTKIDEAGVNIKFSPFDREWKAYAWKNIKSCDVRTYDPIQDYGGWGIRNGAYNVSGNKGLFIRFTNGRHFLIGTQKPEELKKALQKTGKLKQDGTK